MATSGKRSSGRPDRGGREHGLPRSQFRNVSRSACVGAERALCAGRATAGSVPRPSTARETAASARSAGGATPSTEARAATGTGAAGETEQPQPPSSSLTAEPAQQQPASESAHATGEPARKGRTPSSDTATVRTIAAKVEAGTRRELNAPKVSRNPYLSRPDCRPVLRASRSPGAPVSRSVLSLSRYKSFQK